MNPLKARAVAAVAVSAVAGPALIAITLAAEAGTRIVDSLNENQKCRRAKRKPTDSRSVFGRMHPLSELVRQHSRRYQPAGDRRMSSGYMPAGIPWNQHEKPSR